jgi:diguanylate cyclase (GGDEF)-like protein
MPKTDPHTTQRTMFSDGPTQPSPRSACVVVIRGEGLGRRVDIEDRPILVGRSEEAELHFDHRSVSREHCRIWRDGNDYRVRDLDATNSTRVNEQVVAERTLADGDHITIGENVLKFISRTSIEGHYHEEIYQLATHDALTDLCNRRHFIELADKEIARAMRHRRPLSLCIADVDLFKPINDRYGHISGDGVLQQIAARLRSHVRNDDIAARIGGEEFAVLLPECDARAAGQFAERVRADVAAATFLLGDAPHQITISIGVAMLSPRHDTRNLLMGAADAALYRAKSEGRNRVCVEPDAAGLPSA